MATEAPYTDWQAPLDHNKPPPELKRGSDLHDALQEAHNDLLDRCLALVGAAERVPAITDEDAARKVADYIRQISAADKALNGARVAAKEPYLEGGRLVDGFFKAMSDPLLAIKRKVERDLTIYQREKADQERREREERERRAREESEAARRAAAEAEAKMRNDADLDAAVAAQRRAEQAEADRVKADREAHAKAAEMSRTRGDYGAVASLRTAWTFADLDRDALDLAALRHHFALADMEKAVRSYIKAGGRELRGVRIFEDTHAVVR